MLFARLRARLDSAVEFTEEEVLARIGGLVVVSIGQSDVLASTSEPDTEQASASVMLLGRDDDGAWSAHFVSESDDGEGVSRR